MSATYKIVDLPIAFVIQNTETGLVLDKYFPTKAAVTAFLEANKAELPKMVFRQLRHMKKNDMPVEPTDLKVDIYNTPADKQEAL